MNVAGLDETLAAAVGELLRRRNARGWWEGELSTSALSTATAVFAVALYRQQGRGDAGMDRLVEGGLRWLVEHQNEDGGWGDTTKSYSNISTTALCWAALSIGGEGTGSKLPVAHGRAEAWLAKAAGSLGAEDLARAIIRRYGKDKTFSVPILTMCALAGRLGERPWGLIPQLPFELAALPHRFFAALKLPVVSYALPALIAMGLVRHRKLRGWNVVAGGVREMATARTLRVLESIQPEGGGFLEATPLTSFVVMSLIGAGLAEHPVVQRGVEFLVRSVRADGSWPIDTNLATWVTTLSVNALAEHPRFDELLPAAERRAIVEWLLSQQYRVEHPYTHAAPGGWAWTDLPGGVPDADDTPGALVALHNLAADDPRVVDAAVRGVTWLLDLQNRDGGMPTFCRGWTGLPFDRSGADLTAHAMIAWGVWEQRLPERIRARVGAAMGKAREYLRQGQRSDGSWLPLWFGNQRGADDENAVYGTARVMLGLMRPAAACRLEARTTMMATGAAWLMKNRNGDGGWGAGVSSIEETALAVSALCECGDAEAARAGVEWIIRHTDGGRRFEASPIGFYFAKLWYFEREYPLIFAVQALGKYRNLVGRAAGV